jgi:AbiJ N-terminal domain 4
LDTTSSFSERHGYVTKALQFEQIDRSLRNSLWNFIQPKFFHYEEHVLQVDRSLYNLAITLHERFHKELVHNLPQISRRFVEAELDWFQSAQWYEVYDFCEFLVWTISYVEPLVKEIVGGFNFVLQRERSAYRFVGTKITPIIDQIEMQSLEKSIDYTEPFSGASKHIETAISLFSDRRNPDYRNAIKESISSVESAVKVVAQSETASLGDALKLVDTARPMHAAFKAALLKLYGYTSDEKGIRHALLDETTVEEADARFMLVACSAFVNYLKSRYQP